MSLVWFKSGNTLGLVIVSTFFPSLETLIIFGSLFWIIIFWNIPFLPGFGKLESSCQALPWCVHWDSCCCLLVLSPDTFFCTHATSLTGEPPVLGWHNKNKISSFITLLSNIGKKRVNFSGGQFPPWPPLGCAPAHCITLPLLGLCIHCGSPG